MTVQKLQQKKDKEVVEVYQALDDMPAVKALIMGISVEEAMNGAL